MGKIHKYVLHRRNVIEQKSYEKINYSNQGNVS